MEEIFNRFINALTTRNLNQCILLLLDLNEKQKWDLYESLKEAMGEY